MAIRVGVGVQDAHLNLSTDMLMHVARAFMRSMGQPYSSGDIGKSLLTEAQVRSPPAPSSARQAAGHLKQQQADSALEATTASGGGSASVIETWSARSQEPAPQQCINGARPPRDSSGPAPRTQVNSMSTNMLPGAVLTGLLPGS